MMMNAYVPLNPFHFQVGRNDRIDNYESILVDDLHVVHFVGI